MFLVLLDYYITFQTSFDVRLQMRSWQGKQTYNLTEEELEQIRTDLDFRTKIEYHDFDRSTPSGDYGFRGRFLTNCDIIETLPYYYCKVYAGVPCFVSKFAYDIHGRQIQHYSALFIHKSIPSEEFARVKRQLSEKSKEFEKRYNYSSLQAKTFDYEKWERDFGHKSLVIRSPGITSGVILP